jgi:hypothetical protein
MLKLLWLAVQKIDTDIASFGIAVYEFAAGYSATKSFM